MVDFELLPEGTEWVRCALQVNPFAYLAANGKADPTVQTEAEYNRAIVDALRAENVGVIAITDHWAVDTGESLRAEANAHGITVFPGFEATSKDGVHLLLLFDPETSAATINRYIGACGISGQANKSTPGSLDAEETLVQAKEWGATVIAPHVNTGGGLLQTLTGQPAMKVWCSSLFHAVALGGAALTQGQSGIIQNKDPNFRRENPVAVLNGADVSSARDLGKPGSTTWIKLSARSASALDLAFRTPETRVSKEDPTTSEHPRIVGISWSGGFLDGTTIRFNQSLNVIIGGRGTGKSTVIESIRFALGSSPLGDNAKREHDSTVKLVLGSATEVTLELETSSPSKARFTVSRVVGGQPQVRDASGQLLQSEPADIIRDIEVYGQRELAELARDRQRLTSLLAKYLPRGLDDAGVATRSAELKTSRDEIKAATDRVDALEAKASRLPIVLERLREFDEAGAAARLSDHANMQREEKLLMDAKTALTAIKPDPSGLLIDEAPLTTEVDGLPRAKILQGSAVAIAAYNAAVRSALVSVDTARQEASQAIESLSRDWLVETEGVRLGLSEMLRELKSGDGEEYLRLKAEREELKGLPKKAADERRDLERMRSERATLIANAESARAAEVRELKKAAKKVGRALPGTVQASVEDSDDRSPLLEFIRSLPGRFDTVRAAVEGASSLTPAAFVAICRQGSGPLRAMYPNITSKQAEDFCGLDDSILMEIEELELPVTTNLHLNIGTEKEPAWRDLDRLSTGQRATALLLLLLKRGSAPLIIDQPEDDLDNSFINTGIVPQLRVKGLRQIVFSSHNANIPVLGDADQLVVLEATDRDGDVVGSIAEDGLGSIDHPRLRHWVEELLEGGQQAFNTRRYLYGF